jgi:lysosomal alpha-mannosidase
VWEEVSFLSRWWQQANEQQKDAVRKLHAAGQLEFIGGGWVMHDEADTSMRGILNQMTEGLLFLNTTLGVRPTVGWHIDPFGHSSFTPELYSLLTYDVFVLNRIPDPIKQRMKRDRDLEFHWRNRHTNRTVFAHVLDSHYATPVILGFTVEEKAKSFADICRKRLQWFKTDNLLLPFGNDFHFQNAPSDFKYMDEILQYIRDHPNDFDNLTVQYSTLSEYFKAVFDSGVSFNVREDDFFPYVACSPCFSVKCGGLDGILFIQCGIPDAYWSGFYTSKPAQKLLVREQESSLHALEQINALHPHLYSSLSETLNLARNTSALLQHHDAITGTSYPGCYEDYNLRLLKALRVGNDAIAKLKTSALCGDNATKVPALQTDSLTALSQLTDDNTVAVVVQNTLETTRDTYIRISVPDNVCIKAADGSKELLSQMVDGILYIAVHLQPLAVQAIWLKKIQCENTFPTQFSESVELSNGHLKLLFNESGHLTSWTDLVTSASYSLQHEYLQEVEKAGLIEVDVCTGTSVYTFVPDDGSHVLTPKAIPLMVTASGPIVWEVKQQINQYINTTWRLFRPLTNSSSSPDLHNTFAEWQTKIGPLPPEPHNSVLSHLHTGTTIAGYTTYASGYYPVKRSYNSSVPLQGNTYPLVGRAVFSLDNRGGGSSTDLAVITQRPVALSSDAHSVDLMLHRRIKLLFDARGDDSSVMDDPILLGFIPSNSSGVLTAHTMREHRNPPTLHFAVLSSSSEWTDSCHSLWLPIRTTALLPQSVQSHSMRLLKQVSPTLIDIGIRLINTDESVPQQVDIGTLFSEWNIAKWREMTPDFLKPTPSGGTPTNAVVHLLPLELKSLVLQLKKL